MLSEPPQTQESGSLARCPKNPFGHRWKAVAVLEDRVRASLSLLPADQSGPTPAAEAWTRAAAEGDAMSLERLAALIHEQAEAIAALERQISTHEAIRRLLRVLALEEITLGQASSILAETAERTTDLEQQALYRQAIAELRQMQADEHGPGTPLSQGPMATVADLPRSPCGRLDWHAVCVILPGGKQETGGLPKQAQRPTGGDG